MIPDRWLQEILILEVEFAHFVQQRCSCLEKFFSLVNLVTDPGNAVLYLYACIAVLCGPFSTLSSNLMIVGSIINWSATEFKWLLRGDRPYWWIKEIEKTVPGLPSLRQTHDTCIANPGNPSNHVMLVAGIMFVLFNSLFPLNGANGKKSTENINESSCSCRTKIGLWALYIIILIAVMFSRIYNASHFPHQCVLGAIIGVAVSNTLAVHWNSVLLKRGKTYKIFLFAILPLVLAVVSYWLQKAIGIDPQLAVRLAFKWCFSPMEIDVNTTSIYLLTNSCGSLLGIVLALFFQRLASILISGQAVEEKIKNESGMKAFLKEKIKLPYLANAFGTLLTSYVLIQLKKDIPTDKVLLFYFYQFLINAGATFMFLGFVPVSSIVLGRKMKIKLC